ncbi:hypothetical protein VFPPC_16439 [Pochonia chlamydosporia 170]|uniref:Uncharacterized protein n=1 Tax=Pochonia chlamydosporia 170 TaxID=1380566 RepID=A0A179FCV2_METCM|nr:hypothetical protein VFPPC_16439 [Pochonia chlamydosporia 170]OAQ63207.1 hypothetical protein VFPPC_16439 [Pochonia chlamydosporia 170]
MEADVWRAAQYALSHSPQQEQDKSLPITKNLQSPFESIETKRVSTRTWGGQRSEEMISRYCGELSERRRRRSRQTWTKWWAVHSSASLVGVEGMTMLMLFERNEVGGM